MDKPRVSADGHVWLQWMGGGWVCKCRQRENATNEMFVFLWWEATWERWQQPLRREVLESSQGAKKKVDYIFSSVDATLPHFLVHTTRSQKLLYTAAALTPTTRRTHVYTKRQINISLTDHCIETGITRRATVNRDVTASGKEAYRIALETPQLLWSTSARANRDTRLLEFLSV